jgi:hypothetical protein
MELSFLRFLRFCFHESLKIMKLVYDRSVVFLWFILFFFICLHKRGKAIQARDLHFIRRDISQLNYLLETL